MDDSLDRDKLVDCMFDPVTASIIAALEDGPKECSYLARQGQISESQVLQRLDYLLQHGFVHQETTDEKCIISADSQKLSKIVEDDNFNDTVSALEKMDSYLN